MDRTDGTDTGVRSHPFYPLTSEPFAKVPEREERKSLPSAAKAATEEEEEKSTRIKKIEED
jgi:hypothetical protein